jgi:hypothetical protein
MIAILQINLFINVVIQGSIQLISHREGVATMVYTRVYTMVYQGCIQWCIQGCIQWCIKGVYKGVVYNGALRVYTMVY